MELPSFISASVIHSHEWGETSGTTSLLLIQAIGY